jgi:predicted O-methyltransferase YrrM
VKVAMMRFGIVDEKVENYLVKILRPRDKILSFLEKDAEENDVPIIGPLGGNLLSLVATACKAKNILEIGTATGYSGIWLGRVAKENSGKLTTIEMDPERGKIASRSFAEAGLKDTVEILLGDAKEIVPKISREQKGKFDMVFLDVGDKSLYADLLDHLINAVRIGGYLAADNVLLKKRVSDPKETSLEAKTMRKFNKLVYADDRLLPVIVPLRDGVAVALKVHV